MLGVLQVSHRSEGDQIFDFVVVFGFFGQEDVRSGGTFHVTDEVEFATSANFQNFVDDSRQIFGTDVVEAATDNE